MVCWLESNNWILAENGDQSLLGKIVLWNITESFVGKIVFGPKSPYYLFIDFNICNDVVVLVRLGESALSLGTPENMIIRFQICKSNIQFFCFFQIKSIFS